MRIRNPVWIYVALIVSFLVLLINEPMSSGQLNRYDISSQDLHQFLVLINMPLIVIWLASLYSLRALQKYVGTITGSPEEPGFKGLARGCQWLVWGLPISAVLTLILAYFTDDRNHFASFATIFSNYAALFLIIIAFSVMSQGARQLIGQTRTASRLPFMNAGKQVFLAVIGVAYSYLIIRNFQNADLVSASNQYALPLWILILSLIIPYLYAWFLGILTVLDIVLLAKHTPGILYRQSLRALAGGLVLVILSLIAVQFLKAWIPGESNSMIFSFIAAYAIYAIGIAGFLLIGEGAKRMQKMEEV
jgi:hypothetical protein